MMSKMTYEDIPPMQITGQIWYNFFVSPGYRLFRHLCLIAVFLMLIFHSPSEYRHGLDIYIAWGFCFCTLGLVYLNMYFFVPRFLIKGRFFYYFLDVFITGVISFILICWADRILDDYRTVPRSSSKNFLVGLFEFLILFAVVMAASSAVKLFQHWIKSVEHLYRLQKLNFQHELSLLKSQINPHFLFNTLNNAHILIAKEPSRASSLLISLSDLLRYQIYDCSQEFIFLSSDIRFMEDFLTLESVRRDFFVYDIQRTGEPQDIRLPPLLFIPFVENAVKHNHDSQAPSFVRITIHLEKGRLTFACINSKPFEVENHGGIGYGGIGHSNIKRRLSLLYPGKHSLTIDDHDHDIYNVKLEIDL